MLITLVNFYREFGCSLSFMHCPSNIDLIRMSASWCEKGKFNFRFNINTYKHPQLQRQSLSFHEPFLVTSQNLLHLLRLRSFVVDFGFPQSNFRPLLYEVSNKRNKKLNGAWTQRRFFLSTSWVTFIPIPRPWIEMWSKKTNLILLISNQQYVTEKMGGAEGTKLDLDFMEMERVR